MILVTGTPRSGTAFYSAYLRSQGLDIGHETMGKDGIASWYLTHNPGWQEYEDATGIEVKVHWVERVCTKVIHLVRNPAHCIASIAYTMHRTSLEWLRDRLDIDAESSVEIAAKFWVAWNELADFGTNLELVRIEDVPKMDLDRNARQHPALILVDTLEPTTLRSVLRAAERYGYEVK